MQQYIYNAKPNDSVSKLVQAHLEQMLATVQLTRDDQQALSETLGEAKQFVETHLIQVPTAGATATGGGVKPLPPPRRSTAVPAGHKSEPVTDADFAIPTTQKEAKEFARKLYQYVDHFKLNIPRAMQNGPTRLIALVNPKKLNYIKLIDAVRHAFNDKGIDIPKDVQQAYELLGVAKHMQENNAKIAAAAQTVNVKMPSDGSSNGGAAKPHGSSRLSGSAQTAIAQMTKAPDSKAIATVVAKLEGLIDGAMRQGRGDIFDAGLPTEKDIRAAKTQDELDQYDETINIIAKAKYLIDFTLK